MRTLALPRRWTRQPVGWIRIFLLLRKRARESDLVHVHGIRAAFHANFPRALAGRPRLVTVHGFHAFHRATRWRSLWRRATIWALRASDLVLVLSEDDLETIRAERLVAPAKVRQIQPLYDPPARKDRSRARRELGLPQSARVALWIGRFSPEKDPLTFVKAMERIDDPDFVALMVGDGELLGEARAASGQRTKFTGWLDDPAGAFAAADLYVNTSLWETGPITALEAASCRLPLVLSDAPGNRRLIARDGGTAFTCGRDDELARVVGQLVASPSIMEDASGRAAALALAFSPSAAWEQLREIYQEFRPPDLSRAT